MVAGLQVFNDAGTIQIDDTFANFVLISQGSVVLQTPVLANDLWPYYNSITYITIGSNYLMALEDYQWFGAVSSTVNGNGTTTYKIISWSPPGTTMYYYIFDRQPNAHYTNYGFLVYNASGVVNYSSDFKPLRIAAWYEGTITGSGDESTVGERDVNWQTVPTGRTYAVLITQPAWYVHTWSTGGTYYNRMWSSRVLISNGAIYTGRLAQAAFESGSSGGSPNFDYKAFIQRYTTIGLDVTGYR